MGRFVARHRGSALVQKLAGLCRRYLHWFDNHSHDLRTNGETFVLDALAQFEPGVVFDVGANVGDWTLAAKQSLNGAEVHAFEISPPTFDTLVARTKSVPGVHCRNFGLSDEEASIDLRHYRDYPALTTSTLYPHPFDYEVMSAEVVPGDVYAAREGLERVDFLKIDVEGMEPRVLKGFDRMISAGTIDVVQFEYGRVAIMNRFLLCDFYAFFEERGYVVGKIFPNYVDFRPYTLSDEDFVGPNYLACRQELTDVIRALGRPASAVSENGHG